VHVSVNLSVREFRHPGLLAEIEESLRGCGAPAGALELELSEDSLIDDPERAADVVERLHGLGVRLVLDRFGTGYSSLGALHRFPLHGVKIDRSFVQALGDPRGETNVVRSAVALARGLELDTVAQGVETAEQFARLRTLGCAGAQGFHLAPPQEPEAATAILRSACVR
jgi:EAL domain-containing protein (putative c-di-GMP-specific phosphodiesterase class I)